MTAIKPIQAFRDRASAVTSRAANFFSDWPACRPSIVLSIAICFLSNLLLASNRSASGQDRFGNANRPQQQLPASAADSDWQFRFDLFQMLLEQNGLRPLTLDEAVNRLDRGNRNFVLISLGRQVSNPLLPRLREIVSQGKVFVATDSSINFQSYFFIQSGPVEAVRQEDAYQGYADCVIVTDLAADGGLVGDAQQLIVNRGARIADLDDRYGNWTIHARYPARTRSRFHAGKPLLASLTLVGQSAPSFYVSADQSLFSNGMIWHGDNAMLAIQLSYLLAQGNEEMLFVVDGNVMPSYASTMAEKPKDAEVPPIPPLDDLPPESIPEPTLEQMLKVLNRVASKVEDSDLLNEVVANQPRRILEPYYRRLLLLIAAALILIYAIYRLSKPPSVPSNPSTTLAVGPPPIDTSNDFATAEQRGVAARFLARDFFIQQTGSTDARKWREFFLGDSRERSTSFLESNKKSRKTNPLLSKSASEADTVQYLISIADGTNPPLLTSDELVKFGVAVETLRASTAYQ